VKPSLVAPMGLMGFGESHGILPDAHEQALEVHIQRPTICSDPDISLQHHVSLKNLLLCRRVTKGAATIAKAR
jgi:hypothetical protein